MEALIDKHQSALISVKPTGRICMTRQLSGPKTASMRVRNSSSMSFGTKACTVPPKPPPWIR